jgi:hypothetical protein
MSIMDHPNCVGNSEREYKRIQAVLLSSESANLLALARAYETGVGVFHYRMGLHISVIKYPLCVNRL